MDRRPVRSKGVMESLTIPGRAGDSRAWDRFWALYRARDDVFAYVATRLGDHAAAEDVTALAFERAYRRRRTFDRRRGEERAWLFGCRGKPATETQGARR